MDAEAQKLTALEEELRRDLDAITRVKQLIALKNGSLSRVDDRQLSLISGKAPTAPEEQDEDEDSVSSSETLIGTVEKIVNSVPSSRWTTQKVLNHLNETGYPLKAGKPVYSVGQALQKLVKQEKIRRVRKGRGSEPNIYRAKMADETEGHSRPEQQEVIG